jgi:hypothetical protein
LNQAQKIEEKKPWADRKGPHGFFFCQKGRGGSPSRPFLLPSRQKRNHERAQVIGKGYGTMKSGKEGQKKHPLLQRSRTGELAIHSNSPTETARELRVIPGSPESRMDQADRNDAAFWKSGSPKRRFWA